MSPIYRVIKYSKSLWPYYGAIGLATVVLALLNQLQPLLVKGIVDRIVAGLGGGEVVRGEIIWLVLLIFVADASVTVVSNIGGYLGDVMSIRLRKLLTLDYFKQLMKLPQSYFDSEKTGAIINRLDRSMGELTNFMKIMSNNFLQFILTTIFTLIIISFFSWEVALLLAALYPIFLWLTQRTSHDWQKHQRKINEIADVVRARFVEGVAQVKVVKAFVREKKEADYQEKGVDKILNITKVQSKQWHKRDIERRLVLNLIFLGVYATIGIKGFNGSLSVGEIVLLVQYAGLIRIPLFSMSFLVDSSQRAISGSEEFFKVMEIEPELKDQDDAKSLHIKNAEIEFDSVSFKYDKGKQVLNDVSFVLQPGKKLALVGESGQGKTTISNLLLRLYDPSEGMITIDGQNIAEVRQESLRSNLGVVFQDPALFSGTIRENIVFGKSKAAEQEMIEASKAANAHEFISKLENGYDSEIGERGIKLSGGQKQRVAIARAILNNPPILILDEATSSLDSKAEAQVQEALERLMRDRTTMIIAHRLSTIQHVDTIVTLKGGKVDEIGSPKELAKTKGIYSQLLKLQNTPPKDLGDALKQYDLVG